MGTVHELLKARGKQATLEAGVDRNVVEAATTYLSDEDATLGFAYSGWAQCALPHKRQPNEATWSLIGDKVHLVVEPGRKPIAPGNPKMTYVGVPFGAHARLILFFLQTEALRTGSREVELGGSLREWLGRMNVSVGGKTGRLIREQAERISRCRLTFHLIGSKNTQALVNQNIVDRALLIEEAGEGEGRQGRLNLITAKLSEGFFEQLRRHPVPIEESAIKAISNNSQAMDCYLWLAYRLHALSTNRLITWTALKGQFGGGVKELFHFKPSFLKALSLAMAVYPEANLEVVPEGLVLKPSRPPVAPKIVGVLR